MAQYLEIFSTKYQVKEAPGSFQKGKLYTADLKKQSTMGFLSFISSKSSET